MRSAEVLQLTANKGVAAVFDGIGNVTFLQGQGSVCLLVSAAHCHVKGCSGTGFSCLQPRGGMVLFGGSSGFPRGVNLDVQISDQLRQEIDTGLLNAVGS